ncbi:MAG: tRNA (N6-threonylcarbamoyladenosine(37)-N6)-methyltransferase TrmO [Bacteroidaceae bacterium]|nr:tRNA (N6-threonylcarbamoyladenosine(37)-N6)-methyltransferase TrmO [Bacteroidaceae bacterium]
MKISPIAYFHSAFPTKFGIPRQSGLVEELRGTIVFEPHYRNPDALRGLEGFDYLWLLWGFSENVREGAGWSPTVRPPLLGGNVAMGVFATRSPFRPNGLGLSSVKILSIEKTADNGVVINVAGADLMHGTPIYDVKPYVAYSDAHPDARSGFVDKKEWYSLQVVFPEDFKSLFSSHDLKALLKVLALDPRPQYQNIPDRVYGMPFAGREVRFSVSQDGVLTVVDVF